MQHVVTHAGGGLFVTDFLYYPTGTSLYFDTLTIFDAFVTLPFQFVFNTIVAYNVASLIGLIFSGWGAYLLARYLLESHQDTSAESGIGRWGIWLAALVAGFIFTFSPYHMAHLTAHLNLVAMEWIPLYILFLLKAVNDERWRYVPVAGLFLALTALADWYYVMYLLIFTVFFFVFRVLTAHRKFVVVAGDGLRMGGTILVFAALVSPMLFPMLQSALTSNYGVHDPIQTLHHAPDLLAFFLPTPLHPLWGSAASQWTGIYGAPLAEKMVFLGYLPMALAAIGVWRFWKRNRFWLIVAVAFFLLALGPILHVNGVTNFTAFDATVPLPYLLLYYVPFVKTSRAVARFDVIVMLSLGIMAAWGLVALMNSAIKRRWPVMQRAVFLIPVVALLVIAFEFLPAPFKTSAPQVPAFYQQIGQEKGDFAVLDIPFNLIRSRYLLYQTVHEKKIVGGYISRIPQFDFVQNTPAVQQLVTLSAQPDINKVKLGKTGENVLNYYDIRYVVVHKTLDKPDAVQKALDMAAKIFKRPPDYQDDSAVAYRVHGSGRALFVNVGDGWHDKESTDAGPARWMAQEASLEIVSSTGGPARLKIMARSFEKSRTLEVLLAGAVLARFNVQPGPNQSFDTGVFQAVQGSNSITLRSVEKADSPKSLGISDDTRLLSFSVSNVEVSE